jgi:multiple antibiotic resistance protein
MDLMLESLFKTFVVFFVVVEPISLVPVFAALTRGGGGGFRRRMAIKGVALSAAIFALFLFSGDLLLSVLGISLNAFKIGGGLLLFMLAVDMVFARQSGLRSATVREQEEARFRQDISVFPLAFPLIAGPGALATLLLLGADSRDDPVRFAALVAVVGAVLVITLALLLAARHVERLIGVTGANVISRLAGVILVALAVQFVIDGVRASAIDTWLAVRAGVRPTSEGVVPLPWGAGEVPPAAVPGEAGAAQGAPAPEGPEDGAGEQETDAPPDHAEAGTDPPR